MIALQPTPRMPASGKLVVTYFPSWDFFFFLIQIIFGDVKKKMVLNYSHI